MASIGGLSELLDELDSVAQADRSEEKINILKGLRSLSSGQDPNKLQIAKRAGVHLSEFVHGTYPYDLIDQAVRLLRSISVYEPTIVLLRNTEVVTPLIALLQRPTSGTAQESPEVQIQIQSLQLNACATLWNLSVDDSTRQDIVRAGAVDAAINLLKEKNEKCHIEVAGLLRNLALSHEAREHLLDGDALNFVLPLIRETRHVKTKRNLEILVRALAQSPASRERIINLGGQSILDQLEREEELDDEEANAETHHVSEADIIPFHELTVGSKLGSGTFGSVYSGELYGFPVALKVVKKEMATLTSASLLRLLQHSRSYGEFRLLRKLQHPNIPIAMGASIDPQQRVVFITELCVGSLKDILYELDDLFLRLRMLHDLVVGLRWMHSYRVIHRDLKLANLLATEDNHLKITDLGLSVVDTGQAFVKFGGNVKYSAPELLTVRESQEKKKVYPYSEKTDVYSLGYLLWEFLRATPLFPGIKGKQALINHVMKGNRPVIPDYWPTPTKNLVTNLNSLDASQRMTFAEVHEQLADALLPLVCPDPPAQQVVKRLWKKKFYRDSRPVLLTRFEQVLMEETQTPLESLSQRHYNALLAIVSESGSGEVTAARFCRAVAWFGPIRPLDGFCNEILSLLKQKWFHGYISQSLTEQRLAQNSLKQNFLLSFSLHNAGGFIFSYVARTSDGEVEFRHRQILHLPQGYCLDMQPLRDTTFDSLASLVKRTRSHLGLGKPVRSRDFRYLFE